MSGVINRLHADFLSGIDEVEASLRLVNAAAVALETTQSGSTSEGRQSNAEVAHALREDLFRSRFPHAFLSAYGLFEFFLLCAYREALVAKPSLIGNRTVRGETFAVVADLPELLRTVAEGRARELAYQPLDELLGAIRKIFGVAVEPDERLRLLEIRETRNALTHNAGVAGRDYARLPDAVRRAEEGQSLLLDEVYRAESSSLLLGIAGRVRDAA